MRLMCWNFKSTILTLTIDLLNVRVPLQIAKVNMSGVCLPISYGRTGDIYGKNGFLGESRNKNEKKIK